MGSARSEDKAIRLTAVQTGWVQWAVDAMIDYATEEDNEGYGPEDVPRIEGHTIIFPTSNPEMIDDLLYRLEEQLPDVAEMADTVQERIGAIRAADAAATKVRDVFPEGARMHDMRRRDPDWMPEGSS